MKIDSLLTARFFQLAFVATAFSSPCAGAQALWPNDGDIVLLGANASRVNVPASQDSFVHSGLPLDAFGTDSHLRIGGALDPAPDPPGVVGAKRALVQFALEWLPREGLQVLGATFNGQSADAADSIGSVEAHAAASAWDENVTWSTSPMLGGALGSLPTPVSSPTSMTTEGLRFAVRSWIEDPATNHGIAFTVADPNLDRGDTLASRQHPNSMHRPWLEFDVSGSLAIRSLLFSSDTYVDELNPSTPSGDAPSLHVSNASGARRLSLLDLEIPLEIRASDVLKVFIVTRQIDGTSNVSGIALRQVTAQWESSSVDWSTSPTLGETLAVGIARPQGPVIFESECLTAYVKATIRGEVANLGFALTTVDPSPSEYAHQLASTEDAMLEGPELAILLDGNALFSDGLEARPIPSGTQFSCTE